MPEKPAQLTDNSGGTANNTVAAIPNPADTPASADALRDDIVATVIGPIKDAIADLTAKVNAITAPSVGATFGPNSDRTANDPNTNGS